MDNLKNVVLNRDCFEVFKEIENESIDLCLCDPPYGIDLKATRSTSAFAGVTLANDNQLDWVDEFFTELYRVTKNVSFIFCGWSTVDYFMISAKNAGFKVKNVLVWDKKHFGMGYNFRPRYELILLLCKTNFTTKRHDLANILEFQRISPKKLKHIAEKPVDLLKLLIEESTNENDIVFDPFAGSFSVAQACVETNRQYIACELEEEYCKIGEERLSISSNNKDATS